MLDLAADSVSLCTSRSRIIVLCTQNSCQYDVFSSSILLSRCPDVHSSKLLRNKMAVSDQLHVKVGNCTRYLFFLLTPSRHKPNSQTGPHLKHLTFFPSAEGIPVLQTDYLPSVNHDDNVTSTTWQRGNKQQGGEGSEGFLNCAMLERAKRWVEK